MPARTDEDADYALQAKTKAVVFTHINLKPEVIRRRGPEMCIEEYAPLFEGYLKCRNVGLVYLYLSLGVEQVVRAAAEGKDLVIPAQVFMDEAVCLDILQLAEDQARKAYPDRSLRFIYVTTSQLVPLLSSLYHVDPRLKNFLHGNYGVSTQDLPKIAEADIYSSPKFVEAVIRIARGQDDKLSDPVVRFDEHVHICEKSLDVLLTKCENLRDRLILRRNRDPYFFFSGSYGDPNDPSKFDPLNDREVHTHWFGDEDQTKLFLRDLGEVGATQLTSTNVPPSVQGVQMIGSRRFSINRDTCQVISGAGLIMSRRAIKVLPPFMNLNRLIVWPDDHLRRQLHEALGHIPKGELESVVEARFKQDRYPDGITAADIAWAARDKGYFDALLAGCMMDSLISQPIVGGNGGIRKPTQFAEAIEKIIADPCTKIDYSLMTPKLGEYAGQRYDEVLSLWRTPEFMGTALYEWATTRDMMHKQGQVDAVVEDAFTYLELVKCWKESFVAAIEGLRNNPIGNLWLFEPVR